MIRAVKPAPRCRWRQALPLSVLLLFGAGIVAYPASIEVDGDAAFAGSFGLRVTPGCGHPFTVELTPATVASVPEEVAACTTIYAEGIEIGPPGAVFRASEGILFGDLFRIAESTDFAAVIDLLLRPFAWVQDNSPVSESVYRASFYINLDGLSLAEGDRIEHFVGRSIDGVDQFRVVLKHNALLSPPENRLVLEARLDGGGYLSTSALNEELWLESGWNEVVLHWRAAPGADDGWFRADLRNIDTGHTHSVDLSCVEDASRPCLENSAARIDLVRWGVVDGVLEQTTGGLLSDEFASWRN